MAESQCPRPSCDGVIIRNQCNRCGAFSYIGRMEGLKLPGGREIPDPPTRKAPPVPFRPLRLMTGEQWKLLTWTRWHRRSSKLKAIDRALTAYERDRSEGGFKAVGVAFGDWVEAKGGIKGAQQSIRNHKSGVEYLRGQLAGEKVHIPGDLPEFMEAGMENARLGVLYVFKDMRVKPNVFSMILEGGISIAGGVLQSADIGAGAGGLKNAQSVKIAGEQLLNCNSGGIPAGATADQVSKINNAFKNVIHLVVSGIGQTISGIDVGDAVATIVGMLKGVIKALANVFLQTAAPFIGGAMDVASGLVQVAESAVDLARAWYHGHGVELMSGHPAVISKSLKLSMGRSLLKGLYKAVKGIVSTAMEAVGAAIQGVGEIVMKIVTIIYDIFETLIKLAFKLLETILMDTFCKKAKQFWGEKDLPEAFHKSPTEFNRWYRKWAMPFPALAALTLNSGVCGDKMRYLRMFKDDDAVISQDQFDQGVYYLDGILKPYASKYLEEAGYGFGSSDTMIQGMVKRESVWRPTTTGGKISKFLLKAIKT